MKRVLTALALTLGLALPSAKAEWAVIDEVQGINRFKLHDGTIVKDTDLDGFTDFFEGESKPFYLKRAKKFLEGKTVHLEGNEPDDKGERLATIRVDGEPYAHQIKRLGAIVTPKKYDQAMRAWAESRNEDIRKGTSTQALFVFRGSLTGGGGGGGSSRSYSSSSSSRNRGSSASSRNSSSSRSNASSRDRDNGSSSSRYGDSRNSNSSSRYGSSSSRSGSSNSRTSRGSSNSRYGGGSSSSRYGGGSSGNSSYGGSRY